MTYEINNKLAVLIGLNVEEVRDDGVVTLADSRPEFCNRYGIAHGGFLHTLAHLSSMISAEINLGGSWEMTDVSCQYLRALRQFPAKTVTTCVSSDPIAPVYLAEVYDAKGALCYTQTGGLKKAEPYTGEVPQHTQKITSANPMPPDLNVEPPFPCLSTSFSRFLNCYSIRQQGTGLVYALDLNETNCDETGAVHRAAVFTVADTAVGGSLVRIEKKNPITVSASIRFLKHTRDGLVAAIPRLKRGGRSLFYYDVDIVDGKGECVAFAQFVIQNLEHN